MKDLIERQAAIDALKKHEIELPIYAPRETDVFWDDAIDCCVSEIEALPSAQPDLDEWCTDCKEYDKEKHHCPRFTRVIREALKDAELESCEDAVSRKDAIRWVKTECNPYGKPTLDFESGKKVIEHLKRMSPVTPKAEQRWIPTLEKLPDELTEVNVTWENTEPEPYYDFVKGHCFTGIAEYDRLHVGEPGRARKMIEDAPTAAIKGKDVALIGGVKHERPD